MELSNDDRGCQARNRHALNLASPLVHDIESNEAQAGMRVPSPETVSRQGSRRPSDSGMSSKRVSGEGTRSTAFGWHWSFRIRSGIRRKLDIPPETRFKAIHGTLGRRLPCRLTVSGGIPNSLRIVRAWKILRVLNPCVRQLVPLLAQLCLVSPFSGSCFQTHQPR